MESPRHHRGGTDVVQPLPARVVGDLPQALTRKADDHFVETIAIHVDRDQRRAVRGVQPPPAAVVRPEIEAGPGEVRDTFGAADAARTLFELTLAGFDRR